MLDVVYNPRHVVHGEHTDEEFKVAHNGTRHVARHQALTDPIHWKRHVADQTLGRGVL